MLKSQTDIADFITSIILHYVSVLNVTSSDNL